MLSQPEFWVAVAFVVMVGIFIYVGVPGVVTKALDHRADRIKAELDDARRLKDEAAALVADYKARYASAEREAQDIVTNAKAEAERIAVDAKARMEDFVARRTKAAESKIAHLGVIARGVSDEAIRSLLCRFWIASLRSQ
jgi:F-type H+-transporting ATPase subunit b